MSSMPATAQRIPHLRLVERPDSTATIEQQIEDARALDKLGRRAEARAAYENVLRTMTTPSPSLSSTLMRWIARTYEVDADYAAAVSSGDWPTAAETLNSSSIEFATIETLAPISAVASPETNLACSSIIPR